MFFGDLNHFYVAYQLWIDETLAEGEIGMWKICQCFQKYAHNELGFETCWVELVQLENG